MIWVTVRTSLRTTSVDHQVVWLVIHTLYFYDSGSLVSC